jgi:hypothetical protein
VLFNDTTVERLGVLDLRSLRVNGTVRLLASDRVRGGHIEVHDVYIISADARGYEQRPGDFGVEVIPGAFTLWNQQQDVAVTITYIAAASFHHPIKCAMLSVLDL